MVPEAVEPVFCLDSKQASSDWERKICDVSVAVLQTTPKSVLEIYKTYQNTKHDSFHWISRWIEETTLKELPRSGVLCEKCSKQSQVGKSLNYRVTVMIIVIELHVIHMYEIV